MHQIFRVLVASLAVLIVHAGAVYAQATTGLRGKIVNETGAPIAGASVIARNTADTTRVAGSLTDQGGSFRITLAPGSYRLQITYLGYRPYTREISMTAGVPPVDLGSIQLEPAPVTLEGLEVQAETPPVRFEPDRTIYLTRDMPAVQGGVATDALRSVPELDVDLEGKVTLRGATPQIFINGRPTPMQGEALQQFLQQLPANRIDRVEVMPNPSAKFEAEGAGGIVNIVLKKNEGLGLSGSLGLTAGTRGTSGGFGNLAYQEGRVTLFGSGSLNFYESENSMFDLRQNLLTDPTTFLQQEGGFGNRGRFSRVDLTVEYQLTSKATAWTSVSGGGYGSDSDGLTTYTEMDELMAPTERYSRNTSSDWQNDNYDASLGLRHVFEQGKHELSVEARRSHNGGDTDGRYLRQQFAIDGDPLSLPPELMIDDQDEDETRTWLKADYERVFGDTRLQVGYQANMQSTESRQLRQTFLEEGEGEAAETLRQGYDYEETFHQGYLSLSQSLGKFSVQLGVRAELANTDFLEPTTGATFGNEYSSIFPNVNLGYDLGGGKRLGLNYSKRIQRPLIWYLNPVDYSSDPTTRRVGNPELKPQYTHSFGADLTWMGMLGTLRLAPFYRSTVDSWGQITHADEAGVLTTTWENVASMKSYGAQVSAMLRSTGRLSGNVGVGLFREERDASNLSTDYSGKYFRYNANGNLMVALTSTLNLQGMLWYNSPQDLPQGRRSAFVMTGIGARLQLFDNKATLNVRVEDPFEMARYDFKMRDRTHTQIARNDYSMRSASISLSYNFGRRPNSARRPSIDEAQPPQPPMDPAPVPMP